MVLVPKHWKSRSSPGIVAGGQRKVKAHSQVRGPTIRGGPFGVSRAHRLRSKIVVAGWSSPVARQAHNLKVVGSNPTPATNIFRRSAVKLPHCHQWGFLRCQLQSIIEQVYPALLCACECP